MSSFRLVNVIIVGDAGVGKTTLLNRHKTGEFETKYIPTVGVDFKSLSFHTTIGMIKFNVWDFAGQEKYSVSKDEYFNKANAAIVVFDVTSQASFNSVSKWIQKIDEVCGEIPIVVCGNKVDCNYRKVKPKVFHQLAQSLKSRENTRCYDISAKANYNFEKPFLCIAHKLIDEDLHFVEAPALLPPEVTPSSIPPTAADQPLNDSDEEGEIDSEDSEDEEDSDDDISIEKKKLHEALQELKSCNKKIDIRDKMIRTITEDNIRLQEELAKVQMRLQEELAKVQKISKIIENKQ